jgi:FkbM family methyltransferase
MLKKLASRLPLGLQQELKRLHFGWLIRRGLFTMAEAYEKEFTRLHEWVRPGDWVVDVGANVGNYSARLSELVGPRGRVISLEPVPETFELLTANMAKFPFRNVTLLNVAASDGVGISGMTVPMLESGLANRYMAHLTDDAAALSVIRLPVDALCLPERIALVKVDVEGHELAALHGMQQLLRRNRPVLIVEGRSDEVAAFLGSLGYGFEQADGSPNRLFRTVS